MAGVQTFNLGGHTYTVKAFDRVPTDLYVDAPLTNISIAYKNTDFIADAVLPKVPVTQETGIIWKMGMENFAIKSLERGDKAKSKSSGYTVDASTTYRIINYALNDVVTAGMRAQAAPPMNPEADTTEYLTGILGLNKEYAMASALFNTGATGFLGYTEALSTSAARYRWNDYTNSTPIDDVWYAKSSKITANSGATSMFNMIVGADVWLQLINHPDILERIKYTQTAILNTGLVASAMGLDNIYIGEAMYNSANEGQTASLARVWGKYALVYHKGNVGLKTSACAALLHGGNWVRKWVNNELQGATVVEVQEAFQVKLLSAQSGYLFSTAVT